MWPSQVSGTAAALALEKGENVLLKQKTIGVIAHVESAKMSLARERIPFVSLLPNGGPTDRERWKVPSEEH